MRSTCTFTATACLARVAWAQDSEIDVSKILFMEDYPLNTVWMR